MHVPCTWLECEKSVQMEIAVSCEYLAGKTFPQDTHETFCFARLYYLIHTFCTYTIYIHITHKWEGEPLKENLSKNTWELEIVIPTFLYIFVCGISSSLTSPLSYHWEVDSPNTYHTRSKCQVIVWCFRLISHETLIPNNCSVLMRKGSYGWAYALLVLDLILSFFVGPFMH